MNVIIRGSSIGERKTLNLKAEERNLSSELKIGTDQGKKGNINLDMKIRKNIKNFRGIIRRIFWRLVKVLYLVGIVAGFVFGSFEIYNNFSKVSEVIVHVNDSDKSSYVLALFCCAFKYRNINTTFKTQNYISPTSFDLQINTITYPAGCVEVKNTYCVWGTTIYVSTTQTKPSLVSTKDISEYDKQESNLTSVPKGVYSSLFNFLELAKKQNIIVPVATKPDGSVSVVLSPNVHMEVTEFIPWYWKEKEYNEILILEDSTVYKYKI